MVGKTTSYDMTKVKISRAFDAFGNIVSIDDAPRGKSCNCTCIGCGGGLIARKGERAAHFSHDPNSKVKTDCSWFPETDIHIIAKEIILEDKCLMVPIGTIKPRTELIIFDRVTLEARQDSRIPDIVAELNGEVYYIEIAVTHPCDRAKVQDYKRSNKNCLEVDLSEYRITGEVVSKNELREIINSAESTWVSVAPTGDYALKINNHNLHQISELHKWHKKEKAKLQDQITTLQANVTSLQRSENSAQAKTAYATTQLKQVNYKLKRAKSSLENYEKEIEHHNSNLQQVYEFEENKKQHTIWHENAIAANNRRESELEMESFRLSSLKSRLEDENKALERKQWKLEQYEKSLANKESRLNNTIETRALELTETKFALLLKDKQSEIDEYDNKVKDAEKRFAEVKRKYGSYINV